MTRGNDEMLGTVVFLNCNSESHAMIRRPFVALLALAGKLWLAPHAAAFCRFFVAKADANLFNRASNVVIARDGRDRVITMANDYEGEPEQFAMVIPAPYVLERNQIRVAKAEQIEELDAYSAPRLAEYYDPDPCFVARKRVSPVVFAPVPPPPPPVYAAPPPAAFGVNIEAEYEVEEYDILILSAEDSSGLQRWLTQEGYRIPEKARPVLAGYIAMGMKFFVAKVDLTGLEAAKDDDWDGFLRRPQISYQAQYPPPRRGADPCRPDRLGYRHNPHRYARCGICCTDRFAHG